MKLLAFTFSSIICDVISHMAYICLLPLLMMNFKEPLLLTFFSSNEIQKSLILCMITVL